MSNSVLIGLVLLTLAGLFNVARPHVAIWAVRRIKVILCGMQNAAQDRQGFDSDFLMDLYDGIVRIGNAAPRIAAGDLPAYTPTGRVSNNTYIDTEIERNPWVGGYLAAAYMVFCIIDFVGHPLSLPRCRRAFGAAVLLGALSDKDGAVEFSLIRNKGAVAYETLRSSKGRLAGSDDRLRPTMSLTC